MKVHNRGQGMPVLLWLAFTLALSACAPLYFESRRSPDEMPPPAGLGALTWRESWHGFVFNGEKVGFTHLKITPLPDGMHYLIACEAHLKILFLGMQKTISLISEDRVRPDLTLVSFRYEQRMGDRTLHISGNVTDGRFRAVQRLATETKMVEKDLPGPLYPTSAINLYPVLRGLRVGTRHRFTVFDAQTQTFEDVDQCVASFEESRKLSVAPSFRVETQLHGHSVSTWINARGESLLEMALGGVLITYREDEKTARQFLADASLNKKDLILDFSLVRTEIPLPCPRSATYLSVALEGVRGRLPLLQGPGQRVTEQILDGVPVARFDIRAQESPATAAVPLSDGERRLYLAPTHHMESDHADIRGIAAAITVPSASPLENIRRLAAWVATEVQDDTVESTSALEVLRTRRGECQAHTLLYGALARAAGIPTRLAGGLVSLDGIGFLYHSWAESYAGGWVAVDPSFNQVGVDATHIKLVQGPDWTATLPLGTVAGKVRARVMDYRSACRQDDTNRE